MKRQLIVSRQQEYLRTTNPPENRRTRPVLASCLFLMAFTLACQSAQQSPVDTRPEPQSTADTRPADEAALRKLEDEWSKAAGDKDLAKTVSYYSDDALVMPSNAPTANTKDAVRKVWSDTLTSPGFSGGWKTTKAEVARSGDIGYTSGTYEFTMNDASGKPATDRGKYVAVWKKQADGSWKCTVDIWNSDLPAPEPPEKK